jgi:GT2 family glycosyltransferase
VIAFPACAPEVTVVILAMRNVGLLEESLQALAATTSGEPPFEVLIILNGASPEVTHFVTTTVRGARVVESPVNLGTGGGFNRAFVESSTPFLVILHDDSPVDAGWLAPLVETALAHPDAGAVGARIMGMDGALHHTGRIVWADGSTSADWHERGPIPAAVRSVDYHGGLGLLVRRDAWEQVGGFDDVTYFPAFYGDADFCLRLQESGWRVLCDARATVRHHAHASTDSRFRQFIVRRHQRRLVERHRTALLAHGAPARHDPAAIAAEVARAASRPVGAVPPGGDVGTAAALRQRTSRTDAMYRQLAAEVSAAFAHQTRWWNIPYWAAQGARRIHAWTGSPR